METFLPSEKEEAFNQFDISILQARRKDLKFSAIAGSILLPMIAVASIQFILDNENKIQIQISAAIALIAMTLLLSRRDIRSLDGHIKNGKKTIVRGKITDKYNRGGNKASRTNYLSIEELKVRVPLYIYEAYKVGDQAEFHIYKPLYNLLLYEEKI